MLHFLLLKQFVTIYEWDLDKWNYQVKLGYQIDYIDKKRLGQILSALLTT